MPDTPVEPKGSGPYDPDLGQRVSRLEDDMRDVKTILGRLEPLIVRMDAVLPHLATKADVADLRGELSAEIARTRGDLSSEIARTRGDLSSEIERTRGDLSSEIARTRGDLSAEIADTRGNLAASIAEKPGKTYLWGVMTALVAAYAAGLAALAVLR